MTEKKTSILQREPLMLLLLGACPALGATADVRAAFGMGIEVLAVLLLSGVIAFGLRSRLSGGAGFATCVLIAAGCASVMQMVLAAFLPSAYNMMGIYAAVVAVTALTGYFTGEARSAQTAGQAAKNAVITGLYFLVILVVTAVIREVLGSASIAGASLSFLQNYKISAMAKAPGAYIVLAVVCAAAAALGHRKEKEGK